MRTIRYDVDKAEFTLDISDIFETLSNLLKDEVDLEEMFRRMGWWDQVLNAAVELLADEYSRKSFNEIITRKREDVLKKLKDEVIKYHADKIAAEIEKKLRSNNDYWKLREAVNNYQRWVWETFGDRERATESQYKPFDEPKTEDIDHGYQAEVAAKIEEILKTVNA